MSIYAVICRLKINEEVMCVLSMFTTFFKYLTYSDDLIYCGLFAAITTLVITNGCLYMGHKPIKQDDGEDLLSNTQKAYSSII